MRARSVCGDCGGGFGVRVVVRVLAALSLGEVVACGGGGNDGGVAGDGGVDASADVTALDADGEVARDVEDGSDVVDATGEVDAGCPSGPFGGGVWPPACWRPFSSTRLYGALARRG